MPNPMTPQQRAAQQAEQILSGLGYTTVYVDTHQFAWKAKDAAKLKSAITTALLEVERETWLEAAKIAEEQSQYHGACEAYKQPMTMRIEDALDNKCRWFVAQFRTRATERGREG